MWQRLFELLDAARDARVLVVGDFMLDRYLYGDAERISPEAPVPVLRIVRQNDALGGAGSVAADIRAIGAVPIAVGLLGDDPEAARVVALLREAGADVAGLVTDKARPTSRKTRLVGLAQHRHRQQLIRVDEESAEPAGSDAESAMIERIRAAVAACSAVCIEDYAKGVVTPRVAAAAIDAARSVGVPVLVDPAAVRDYSSYRGATVVTPNRNETGRLIGETLPTLDAVRRAAARIHAASHCEHVCVTLDADGAALIGPGGTFEHVPTKARDVYDVTGAGDEVLAAMAAAMAAGATLREAVALANVAGGLEVEKFGCVPITCHEIKGEILLEHHQALGKVRDLGTLLPELARRRTRGETVVFTNGCFDLLHVGHVSNLAFCRAQGDIVVVGLNSDASVQAQNKGDGRPWVPQAERAAVLAALGDVDYVVIFDEHTPEALIQAIRPDRLVKGRDWEGRTVAGQTAVEASGGKVVFAPLVENRSTTELIARIRKSNRS